MTEIPTHLAVYPRSRIGFPRPTATGDTPDCRQCAEAHAAGQGCNGGIRAGRQFEREGAAGVRTEREGAPDRDSPVFGTFRAPMARPNTARP